MENFIVRFLVCNIFISAIIGILSAAKYLFKNILTSRMQYHLWFLLLGLLAIPFIPMRSNGAIPLFSWGEAFRSALSPNTAATLEKAISHSIPAASNWLNDFALSVSKKTSSPAVLVLYGIWISGMSAMIMSAVKSKIHLNALKKSALPLQNREIRKIYQHCLNEMHIKKDIPVYSTAFLKSPIITGFLKPCIYLPIHLISDYDAAAMRYILLHELQHYKHKDALANYFITLTGILYWFNPFVWYALKEMCNDREVACDTSVLEMLYEDDYEKYGITLINFAEKVSLTSFPFSSGISGTMKQMKKRILNIASYEKLSLQKKLRGSAAFALIALLLFTFAPALSAHAASQNRYQWKTMSKHISQRDLSAYFGDYKGSFVLYDLENDCWTIHDMQRATLRVAPNSTYKIYDALFGLEKSIITPENSRMAWDKEIYPFEAWNADQNLYSAMSSSVNWYFQRIDSQLGTSSIYDYIQKIGYGNKNITGDSSTYWLESSLKISPVEQVELLIRLYNNDFGFAGKNIAAVKNSIHLFSSESGSLYGKTGTGRINGQNVNGWFIGYVEDSGHTCFFAVNIAAGSNASGSHASEIALSILSDMNIWK